MGVRAAIIAAARDTDLHLELPVHVGDVARPSPPPLRDYRYRLDAGQARHHRRGPVSTRHLAAVRMPLARPGGTSAIQLAVWPLLWPRAGGADSNASAQELMQ